MLTSPPRSPLYQVSSPAAVREFAAEWQSAGRPAISSLVLNAGNLNQQRQMTADGTMEASWATAMCQSYLMTGLMLPSLHASDARIINVSSGGGLTVRCDLEDPFAERRTYDGTVQYAIAKRTQIELADEWSHRLASRPGLLMASMHPGWAVTEGVLSSIPDFAASNEGKLRTPEQGIDTIMWLAAASRDAILRQSTASDEKPVSGLNAAPGSGLFWFDRAPAQKHFWLASTSISNEERKDLWKMCEKLFGWTYQA